MKTAKLVTFCLMMLCLVGMGITPIVATQFPCTGTIVAGNKPSGGLGELMVRNEFGKADAVVCLTRVEEGLQKEESLIVAAYVCKGESLNLKDILDGTYILYFAVGEDWSWQKKTFLKDVQYYRFEDTLVFRTSTSFQNSKDGITRIVHYTAYEVTLYGTPEGKATVLPVSEEEFPVSS